MKIFRVACETYDKTWYVRTFLASTAISLVKDMTEDLGWHLDYPEEERVWDCKEVFTESNVIIENRDL